MEAPAAVPVIHGERSWPIAVRLAMDLRSEGIEAIPAALKDLKPEEISNRFLAAAGLVIIYDGMTWITEQLQAALREVRATRPVVFLRSRTSRFAPGLLEFHVVPIFEGQTFSYYQPHSKGRGGFADLVGFLGPHKRPTDRRRRGFAFLSYSSKDRAIVYERLVPALATCNIGFFDYRFTERLDERKLGREIERHIKSSAIVVAYVSATWRTDRHWIDRERTLAQQLSRPIVAVTAPGEEAKFDLQIVPCPLGSSLRTDSVRLERAIRKALNAATVLTQSDALRASPSR
jgi:TIR domain